MKTTQRLIICNRAPLSSEDGWIHIVPKGELPNREAGIVQVLDDSSLDSILANIEKDKNRLGDKWPGIYAGREHFIYDSGKDSAALGWFKQFQKRPNGIWANDADLTPEGMQAVKNRSYKFTSFVADPADLEKIEGNKYRVKKIETVGFTNFSNGGSATREGHGLLDPVVNRAGQMPPMPEDGTCPDDGAELEMNDDGTATCPTCKKNFADSQDEVRPGASAANQQTNTKKKMKNIATKLGLAAEASEEAILAEVTKIQNRVAELEPLATENTKLKNRITEVDNAAVDNLLAAHGVKDAKVLNRLKPVILATPEADRATALIEFGFKPGEATKPAARVLNRGSQGAAQQQAGGDQDEKAVANKIKNRALELQHKTGRKFGETFAEATREYHEGRLA